MATVDRRLGLTGGIALKAPCVVATTTAIVLGSTQVIDGVAVGTTGERILVMAQSDAETNGIYIASSSTAWSRAEDCNGANDIMPGSVVFVHRGATYGSKFFIFNSSSTAQSLSVGSTGVTITLTAVP